jgi:uncharacterized protein YjbJ (UPF0337 family)
MDKDRIKGNLKKAEGAAKEAVGKLFNDPTLEAEGKVKKAEGTVQNAIGKTKDALRDN